MCCGGGTVLCEGSVLSESSLGLACLAVLCATAAGGGVGSAQACREWVGKIVSLPRRCERRSRGVVARPPPIHARAPAPPSVLALLRERERLRRRRAVVRSARRVGVRHPFRRATAVEAQLRSGLRALISACWNSACRRSCRLGRGAAVRRSRNARRQSAWALRCVGPRSRRVTPPLFPRAARGAAVSARRPGCADSMCS